MTRQLQRLSDRRVRTARPKGRIARGKFKGRPRDTLMLCDGGGLYAQITLKNNILRRSWIYRYQRHGRPARDMGLGSLNDVTLAEARELARRYRRLVHEGKDPIAERDAEIARNLAASTAVMTFDQAAAHYIAQHRSSWGNPVHAAQWPASLKRYVSPIIGRMSVNDLDTAHILKVLTPIWHKMPVTAKRIRGRIESIIGWATVAGYRKDANGHDKPNCARWKYHLQSTLAAPGRIREVKRQPALAYQAMPEFMAQLRARNGAAALALEFAILTAVRVSDVINARREHINRAERRWDIPHLSKTHAPHRVPLSDAAIAVVDKIERIIRDIGGPVGRSEYLFPNDTTGRALNAQAMIGVIHRMGRKGVMSAHGARASFRTWAQEQTNFPWEVCELSLGHKVGDAVARAYARGDALQKRVAIMEAWADYLAKPKAPAKVVPLHQRTAR
jgi:integrase